MIDEALHEQLDSEILLAFSVKTLSWISHVTVAEFAVEYLACR